MLFLLYIALAVFVVAYFLAKRGWFKGDVFVASSVLGCAALMAIFIAYPVGKSLIGAFRPEDGVWSLAAAASSFWERSASERIWGLGCLNVSAPSRCGVAWNTLYLGLLTASGTVIMGTALALLAERHVRRDSAMQKPMQLLAMLPIITPPFVVGLGLILLFGRAGVVNQLLEYLFGIEPSRWFYGVLGVWIAQMFAFTPIAYMMMRGVVQGVSPSLEEAAQSLRANRAQTFYTVTLPLLKPGLANAFLVGFIESMADFGNPIIVGGQFNVLSTEIFFAIVGAQYDQGRAATLALILTGFALAVFALQRAFLAKQNFTTLTGKGDAGLPVNLPAGVRRTVLGLAAPWLIFTIVIYPFA
jgi:iron(III) transport system permease protein